MLFFLPDTLAVRLLSSSFAFSFCKRQLPYLRIYFKAYAKLYTLLASDVLSAATGGESCTVPHCYVVIPNRCNLVDPIVHQPRHESHRNDERCSPWRNWLEENCVCRSDPTTKWERLLFDPDENYIFLEFPGHRRLCRQKDISHIEIPSGHSGSFRGQYANKSLEKFIRGHSSVFPGNLTTHKAKNIGLGTFIMMIHHLPQLYCVTLPRKLKE